MTGTTRSSKHKKKNINSFFFNVLTLRVEKSKQTKVNATAITKITNNGNQID